LLIKFLISVLIIISPIQSPLGDFNKI